MVLKSSPTIPVDALRHWLCNDSFKSSHTHFVCKIEMKKTTYFQAGKMESLLQLSVVALILLHLAVLPLGLGMLENLPLLIYAVLFVYFIARYLMQQHDRFFFSAQILIMGFSIGCFLYALLDGLVIELGIIQRFICFLFLIATLGYTDKTLVFTSRVINRIVLLFCAFAIILSVYSVSPLSHMFDGRSVNALAMNFSNPNFTGELLLCTVFVLIIGAKCTTLKHRKVIWVLVFYCLFMCYQTLSRTSFFTSLLFVIYALFLESRIKVRKTVILLFLIIPFAWVFVYIALADSSLSGMTLLGRDIYTGRDSMYLGYLSGMMSNPLSIIMGDMARYTIGNAHNGPMSLLTSFGVVVTVGFYFCLYRCLARYTGKEETTLTRLSLASILCIMLHSSTEGALVLGGALSSVIFFVLLGMLNSSVTNEKRLFTA